jgi:hypothetical protein
MRVNESSFPGYLVAGRPATDYRNNIRPGPCRPEVGAQTHWIRSRGKTLICTEI